MPTDATDAVYTKTCLPVPQNFYVQGQLGKRSLHTPSTPSAVSPPNCVALNPQVPQLPAKAFTRNDPKHAPATAGQHYRQSPRPLLSAPGPVIDQSAQFGKTAESSEHYSPDFKSDLRGLLIFNPYKG